MYITHETTLENIKTDFNSMFPFLKVEFFNKEHGSSEPSSVKDMITDYTLTVSQISPNDAEGDLRISSDMKVSDLEQKFAEAFGLNVQVFRQSGNIWLLTSNTDNWTLEKQNSVALEDAKVH
jgi:hypothetical protein